jgi:hypothetical protein
MTDNTIIPLRSIIRVAFGTAIILLIPLLLMQFNFTDLDPGAGTGGVNWTLSDFVIMGGMLFVAGTLLDIAWRKMGKYRAIAAAAVAILFLWLWAELAVGVFTNWGS